MPSQEPLYLIATIRPRPDRLEEAERELRALMAGTHAEPGCIFMELVESPDDPTTWIMLEKFRSRQAWDEHMCTDHVTRGNAALADLLREPTHLAFFTERPAP
jgi:quinol monooxygenase YgiN